MTSALTRIARIARRWLVSPATALLALLVFPTACDTLRNPLEVESASRIPAGPLETAANAQLLSDGAIGDFDCAFNSYATQGGTVGEEFIYAQQTASRTPYDPTQYQKTLFVSPSWDRMVADVSDWLKTI